MSFSLLDANEHYPATFRRGDEGWGVIVCQVALNSHFPSPNLILDGRFGPATEEAVKQLQRALRAVDGVTTVDGIAGFYTQSRFCRVKCERTRSIVPAGLTWGVCEGESSGLWAATTPIEGDGGRDYFCMQDHKVNPGIPALEAAANPEVEAWKVAGIVAQEHKRYSSIEGLSEELRWKYALFAYNWPVGADILAKGEQATRHYIETQADGSKHEYLMSDPAPWIEAIGAVFPWNGQRVRTGLDWYSFYVGTKDKWVTKWAVG